MLATRDKRGWPSAIPSDVLRDCALEISMVGETALTPFARGLHFAQLDYFGHENIPFN